MIATSWDQNARPQEAGYLNCRAVDDGTQHGWEEARGGRRQAGLKGVQDSSWRRAGGMACLDALPGEGR